MRESYIICLIQIYDASGVAVLNYPHPAGNLVFGQSGAGRGEMITPNACHA